MDQSLRRKLDRIIRWTGGVTSPVTCIEQAVQDRERLAGSHKLRHKFTLP